MLKKDKLTLEYSKTQDDVVANYPVGVSTKPDARYLLGLFNENVLTELERRGYDTKTIKFSIEPQKGNPTFRSQRGDFSTGWVKSAPPSTDAAGE